MRGPAGRRATAPPTGTQRTLQVCFKQFWEFWELVTKLVFWGFLPNCSECHSFGIPLAGGLAELSRSLPIKLLRGPKKAQNRA